jgi:hypothetical protein
MGRIKDILIKLANKARFSPDVASDLSSDNLIEDDLSSSGVSDWEMPYGTPKTEEETIDEYADLITKIDPKLEFIFDFINEYKEDDTGIKSIFIREPYLMKMWFAHISYRQQTDNFYTLISKSPTGLPASSNVKKIKCITDLPLQKKILN